MSTKIKVCFNGCSFTWGEGYSDYDRELYVYDRLLANRFNFDRTNIAVKGSSNYTIFMRSSEAIMSGIYDIVFVQWSALNRLWLSPGPGAYFFVNDKKFADYRYRDLYISKLEKSNLKNLLLLLNHDYQNIIELIDYCKILNELADQKKTKIFYINGLIPWTNDLNTPLTSATTSLNDSLSKYTKQILDFDRRDDEEIIKYFNDLHLKFKQLDQSNWINLFDSFLKNIVDTAPQGNHPGTRSHQWMADQITTHLIERKIICDI
jgi:hypothetical protein